MKQTNDIQATPLVPDTPSHPLRKWVADDSVRRIVSHCILVSWAVVSLLGCQTMCVDRPAANAPTNAMEERMTRAIIKMNMQQPPIHISRSDFTMQRWDGQRIGNCRVPSQTRRSADGSLVVLMEEDAPDVCYEQEAANAAMWRMAEELDRIHTSGV